MDTSTSAKTRSISKMAASLSWVCPLFAVIIIVLVLLSPGTDTGMRKIYAGAIASALLLVVIGMVLGVVALFGIFRHGAKGIRVPAIIGLIFNGLLLLLGLMVR